jgi:hypothetical protein
MPNQDGEKLLHTWYFPAFASSYSCEEGVKKEKYEEIYVGV